VDDLPHGEPGRCWRGPKIADRVRHSRRVREELDYCAPLGIPRSLFVGERAVPGPGGEAWTEDDVEYALAWQAIAAENCPGCGQPKSESFDPANERAYDVTALVCHACAARTHRQASFEDADGDLAGLYMTVTKTTRRMP
jgi:hypothetical protein